MSLVENPARQRPWTTHVPPHLPSPATATNRRRRLVFLGVFALASVLSLCYTLLRPAEFRAVARVEITPASFASAPVFIAASPNGVNPVNAVSYTHLTLPTICSG